MARSRKFEYLPQSNTLANLPITQRVESGDERERLGRACMPPAITAMS